VQCFQYDYLGRLTQGWSRGTSGCSSGPSQSAEATAAAPYWEQYSYNAIGDMTSEVSTPASGSATTTTESYPATGSAQPHAISSETVDAPSGDASASYEYDDSGQLTSVTGSSEDQSLSWNPTGTLASDKVTPSSGTAAATSYIYDADGNLLIQKDPDSTTLFLKDEELVLNDSTDTVTGTRFYALGGVTTAVRTGSDVSYLIGDEQGTDTIAIAATTLTVTRRYYDPYGDPIGTAPASWPGGEQSFVGGTTDAATGLTNLGAREYQPATDSFISPDALLNPYDPQDLNAYDYSWDNPSTLEDPTGLCPIFDTSCYTGPPETGGGGGGGSGGNSGGSGGNSGGSGSSGGGDGGGDGGCPIYAASCESTPMGPQPTPAPPPQPKPVVRKITMGMSAALPVCQGGRAAALDPTACRPQAETDGGSVPRWLMVSLLIAGGVGLTVINVAQGGLDPVTDAAEGADITGLVGEAADDAADSGDSGDVLYRGDARSPDQIKAAGGFRPWAPGSNTSLYDYASNETPSDYVSTSLSESVAERMALRQGGGYIYAIDPDGLPTVDVNATLGDQSPYPDEQEIAVPGGIPYQSILWSRIVP
jgi:RHS repeat-associated protein